MKVLLLNVFLSLFGPTKGLFKRFKKEWPSVNKDASFAATDELFQDPLLNKLRQEVLGYLPGALETQQPRDDYQEFLRLFSGFLVN